MPSCMPRGCSWAQRQLTRALSIADAATTDGTVCVGNCERRFSCTTPTTAHDALPLRRWVHYLKVRRATWPLRSCREGPRPVARPRRESFLRVHWVAVPKALRARRANRSRSSSSSSLARRVGAGGGGSTGAYRAPGRGGRTFASLSHTLATWVVALHEVLAAALNLGGAAALGGGGGGSIVALGGDARAERDALGVDGRLVLLKCAATLIG
jgi:hypothetical protein